MMSTRRAQCAKVCWWLILAAWISSACAPPARQDQAADPPQTAAAAAPTQASAGLDPPSHGNSTPELTETAAVPPPEPAAGDSATLAALEQLLAQQASAIERYDLDRYLATFRGSRREEESRIFRRLRLLPITEANLRVDQVMEISATEARTRVELRVRFAGLPDDNPFHHYPVYSFVRDQGAWRVADVAGDRARPAVWRNGDLEVHRAHHFLICSRPAMRSELLEVAADAEAAYASLTQRGLALAAGYFVYLAASREEFGQIAGNPGALGAALARYVEDGERFTVDSRAFYINGPMFGRRAFGAAKEKRRVTVTHELVHLALAAESRPTTPPWLKEGAAVFFSGGLTFDATRQLFRGGLDHLSLEAMTRAAALGRHGDSESQAADEYLFAGNVVAYLIEKHGQQRFFELYRSFAERPAADRVLAAAAAAVLGPPAERSGLLANPAGALVSELTGEALARVYGLTVADLEAAVIEWLAVRHR